MGETAQDVSPLNRGDSLQPSVGSVSVFLEAAELRNWDSESSYSFPIFKDSFSST